MNDIEMKSKLRKKIIEGLYEYYSYCHSDWIDPEWGILVDSTTIPGYIVFVSIGDDENRKPVLDIYKWNYLVKWYNRALRYIKKHPISSEWDQDDDEIYDDDDDKKCTLGEALRKTEEKNP